MECRSRGVRLRDDGRCPHREPASHHAEPRHHGSRTNGAEILRSPDPGRDRREGNLLEARVILMPPPFDRRLDECLRIVRFLAVPVCLVLLYPEIAAQAPPPDRDRAAAATKRTEDRLRGLQREADALAAQER